MMLIDSYEASGEFRVGRCVMMWWLCFGVDRIWFLFECMNQIMASKVSDAVAD